VCEGGILRAAIGDRNWELPSLHTKFCATLRAMRRYAVSAQRSN